MSAHHRTAEWSAFVRMARPIIKASLPAQCVNRCKRGGIVMPGERFDVAHVHDAARGGAMTLANVGPAHPGCNRSDGGKLGAAMVNSKRRERKRRPSW